MITLNELNKFYSDNLSWTELVNIASKLDETAQTMPGFHDENDRDAGKDAFNFHEGYLQAVSAKALGKELWFVSRYVTPEQYLTTEIDILIHGCHTEISPIESYVKGGTIELLNKLRGIS